MKKSGLYFLAGSLAAVIGLTVLLYLCGLGFRPDVHTPPPPPPHDELRRVLQDRKVKLNLQNPPRVNQEVDYSQGRKAAWWPKGEAPVLADLVREGKLPPVEERVGPEPVVMKGVDGIGNYGGSWVRLASSDYDVAQVGGLFSYCNLVRWSPEGYPLVPQLAKSWDISDDYRQFTFHLRRGMRWSDGAPVTADDFLYWYNDEVKALGITPPDVLRYPGTGEVARLEKIDDYTIRFSFSQPYTLFLERLASWRTMPGESMQEYCVPSHYLRQYNPITGDKKLIARKMREMGATSPRTLYLLRIKEWKNPEQPRLWPWILRTPTNSSPYVFVRNPYYCAVDPKGNQLPYLDRLVMEVRPQDLFALTAASGQVSMQMRYIRYQDHVLLMSEADRNGYQVYQWYPGERSTFTIFPVINRRVDPKDPSTRWKHQLLNDRRFRQALSLAINRRDIINALFNGQGEPAQIDPGPESSFHSQKLFKSYTAYDPAGANARLDAMGLTKRDSEGFRTFPDGSRMVWYLDMTEATNNDPAQYIVNDWAAVGIRCIPRIQGRFYFELEKGAFEHDFLVWHGESEFSPLVEPRNFVPTYGEAYYAPAYAFWYLFGGLAHNPDAITPRSWPPPPGHPLRRNMELLDEIYRTPDRARQIALFHEIEASNAEQVWTISICTPPPQLVVVKDGFRNVPRTAVCEGSFESPGNTGIETYYWEHPNDSQAVLTELKQTLVATPVSDGAAPAVQKAAAAAASPSVNYAAILTKIFHWLLIGVLVAGLALVAFRHPYVARRLLVMVPTLLVISVVVFTIVQLPPGDFLTMRTLEYESQGTSYAQHAIEALRKAYHLDEPMVTRYLRWAGLLWFTSFKSSDTGLLQGDLGRSMEFERSVNLVVGDRIALTVIVSLATILITWVAAVPIGIYSAVRQYSAGDYALTFLGFLGMSVPSFLLALVLMFISHQVFGLSISGLFSARFAGTTGWSWDKVADLMKHIWVPVVVLGVGGTATMIRVMRANLLDELRKPYVTTARAKGVPPLRLLIKYPVRLALNPVISGLGNLFPQLVSGGAIVAIVLSLPMVGPVMLDALFSQDVYLAGSMLMVMSVLGVFGTLVSDLLLLWLDPRIRFEGGGH